MNTRALPANAANALVPALVTIVILSAVGANVLANLNTRYNVSHTQVRGWKQAQHAAEAAGDIAYAEVRKTVLEPTTAFAGWTLNGTIWSSPVTTFSDAGLVASATAEPFYYDPITGNPWYRIRAKGTAPLRGLKRVGMDDRMGPGTRGDSLLRKIDFTYDHFISAYGPAGDGVDKALVPVPGPQLTRRIELIVAPVTPFSAAIKCQGTFYGLGNAARIDSYDSTKNYNDGRPLGAYIFVANNPNDARFADSRAGSVQIGTAIAEVRGLLYGNLTTNGGRIVRSQYVTGAVDNNVPFSLPPYRMPLMPPRQLTPTSISGTTNLEPSAAGTPSIPVYYVVSSFGTDGKLTINPHSTTIAGVTTTVETYVAIRVTNDVRGTITVKPKVHAQIFFEGSLDVKAEDLKNETGYAGNLQLYAVSPPPNSGIVQQINIASPGDYSAVIYAPRADYRMNGNPDVTGAAVCKTFYGNGNTMWHYDRALDHIGEAVDYRVASYVEDVR